MRSPEWYAVSFQQHQRNISRYTQVDSYMHEKGQPRNAPKIDIQKESEYFAGLVTPRLSYTCFIRFTCRRNERKKEKGKVDTN